MPSSGLNPRYSFDRFVVANSNIPAYSEATLFVSNALSAFSVGKRLTSIAQNASHAFDNFAASNSDRTAYRAARVLTSDPLENQLFIQGSVGTGKTHLMQAIGNALSTPFTKVCYLTSEGVTSALISAFKTGTVSRLYAWIGEADVLLIDDIHLLSGKERTQQEFLRIFDFMVSQSKRIVITADSGSRESSEMNDNLIRKLTSGMVTRIHEADQNLKISIIEQWALEHSIDMFDDGVASHVATGCSTVRKLEGTLTRLLAECSLLNTQLNLDTARKVLPTT